MESGLDTLQNLEKLVLENPNQFEIKFNFSGTIPGKHLTGTAEVYPLLDGEKIWLLHSTNRKRVAYVDLILGQIKLNEDPLLDYAKIQKYGTGPFGEEKSLSDKQLKSIWDDAVKKFKQYLGVTDPSTTLLPLKYSNESSDLCKGSPTKPSN